MGPPAAFSLPRPRGRRESEKRNFRRFAFKNTEQMVVRSLKIIYHKGARRESIYDYLGRAGVGVGQAFGLNAIVWKRRFWIDQIRKIITSVALMRAAAVCPRFSCISLAERAVMIDVIC